MYLLDTMVPSELRKGSRCNPKVRAWSEKTPLHLQFLSVLSIFEMRTGALRRERDDPGQAKALHHWLDEQVLFNFAERLLPVTLDTAERCSTLHIPTERESIDMLIAATALSLDFILVTRNVRHFEPTGVRLLNPWDAA